MNGVTLPRPSKDVLLRNGAGGKFTIAGDYLFRDHVGMGLDNGLWGILRVQ